MELDFLHDSLYGAVARVFNALYVLWKILVRS